MGKAFLNVSSGIGKLPTHKETAKSDRIGYLEVIPSQASFYLIRSNCVTAGEGRREQWMRVKLPLMPLS